MTEAEWLTGEHPAALIEILTLGPNIHSSLRKKRRFCIACCRELADARPDWPRGIFVHWIDEWIDSQGYPEGLEIHDYEALFPSQNIRVLERPGEFDYEDGVLRETCDGAPLMDRVAIDSILHGDLEIVAEFARQSSLLRDIFGNPFRPVAFDPSWRTSTTAAIAKTIYESRDFDAMPLLAEALEDAGCNHADILDHCRGAGPHVRGCWVVDLVLGKS